MMAFLATNVVERTYRISMGPYSRFHMPFYDKKREIPRGKRTDIPDTPPVLA